MQEINKKFPVKACLKMRILLAIDMCLLNKNV